MNYSKLKLSTNDRGYLTIGSWKVHDVVWEQFNGKKPKGFQIDHINGNILDNRIENLQAVTKEQNNNRWRRGTVYFRKDRNKYIAERNQKYLGQYETKCAAQMACNLYYI